MFEQEYIACSAVWFKELEFKKDVPNEQVNPVNIESGITFCGHRHLQCIRTMNAITGLRQAEAGAWEDGFITSKNRFVDRKEGAAIALGCGQIKKLNYGNQLYSEDLY